MFVITQGYGGTGGQVILQGYTPPSPITSTVPWIGFATGPPMPGIPWFLLRPAETPPPFPRAALPPDVTRKRQSAPGFLIGPPQPGRPFFSLAGAQAPFTPRFIPRPPTPIPGPAFAARNKPFLPRAPEAERRQRIFQDVTTQVLNSLMANGQLVQTGPQTWTLAAAVSNPATALTYADPFWALTPAVDADFSWLNQSTTTKTVTNGLIQLLPPAANATQLRVRYKRPYFAAPYSVEALIDYVGDPTLNYNVGVGFYNSTSGKIQTIEWDNNNTGIVAIVVNSWTSATAYSATNVVLSPNGNFPRPLFFRLRDDGTTLKWSMSGDRVFWYDVFSHSRAGAFVGTPDQVMFYIDTENNTAGGFATLRHWKETAG